MKIKLFIACAFFLFTTQAFAEAACVSNGVLAIATSMAQKCIDREKEHKGGLRGCVQGVCTYLERNVDFCYPGYVNISVANSVLRTVGTEGCPG